MATTTEEVSSWAAVSPALPEEAASPGFPQPVQVPKSSAPASSSDRAFFFMADSSPKAIKEGIRSPLEAGRLPGIKFIV